MHVVVSNRPCDTTSRVRHLKASASRRRRLTTNSPQAVLLGLDVDSCGQGLQKAIPTWPPLLYHPTGHFAQVRISEFVP